MKTFILIAIIVVLVGLGLYATQKKTAAPTRNSTPENSAQNQASVNEIKDMIPPFADWKSRATKKHYGTYVEPGNSPVTPERFHGYHTGTDFEILPGEDNIDVPVRAICTGKILRKETARGYGGMVVQACTYDNQPVVIVYGHVRLTSMSAKIGDTLTQGDKFVVLGTGYSAETDGERKHLHLSIHKGSFVITSGYVSTQAQLVNWYDPEVIFKQ